MATPKDLKDLKASNRHCRSKMKNVVDLKPYIFDMMMTSKSVISFEPTGMIAHGMNSKWPDGPPQDLNFLNTKSASEKWPLRTSLS